jgi:uncharacterized membrane protein
MDIDVPAPAAPALPAGDAPTRSRRRPQEIATALIRRTSIWHWALGVAVVWYTAHFARFTLDIHHGMGTSNYDLGLYDQGIWLMSRFKAPFVTLMGRNLMGDHTSFILVFLVPVYWIFPAVGTLLTAQAAAIAAGAIPVFLYAKRRLQSGWMAFLLAMTYLLHPAVTGTNMENFHPDAFLGVLVGFAVYGALERKWKLYAVFVVLALMVKEDVSLVVVPLGVWVGLRRDRRIGLITIVGSLGFMALAMLVIMRSLIGVSTRNTWRIPFGGPTGFLRHTVSHPGEVFEHLRDDSRPFYIWQMTAPFAYAFARLPDVAAISAVVLFTNIMSTFLYQYSTSYHYSLVAVPALALGTVWAIGVMKEQHRPKVVALATLTSIWACYLWGWMPWSRHEYAHWARDHPVAEAMRDIIDDIPSDAAVSAYHSATPHIDHREEIYQFPNPFRIVQYGTDLSLEGTRHESRSEDVDYVLLPAALDEQNQNDLNVILPALDEVERNEYWVLYERDRDEELPPIPPPAG